MISTKDSRPIYVRLRTKKTNAESIFIMRFREIGPSSLWDTLAVSGQPNAKKHVPVAPTPLRFLHDRASVASGVDAENTRAASRPERC